MELRECRGCGANRLVPVLDLGTMAPAHRFRSPGVPAGEEERLPLKLLLCEACQLVQLGDVLPPEILDEEDPSEKPGEPGALATGRLRLVTNRSLVACAPGSPARPLSQTADLPAFFDNLRGDLAGDDVVRLETRHWASHFAATAFDCVQHRHWHYFSLTALQALTQRAGLIVVDIESRSLAKGTLVVEVARTEGHASSRRVAAVLQEEARSGLSDPAAWQAFAARVAQVKSDLWIFLNEADRFGQSFAGYGASARGNTLLAYCGLGKEHLPYIADANPALHGLETPGHRIPIASPEQLLADMPEITLVLSWDQANDVIREQLEYRRRGGRLASPMPMTRLISVAA